jgi:membrane-associated protease RseP (regulator of RpoE activity)
MRRLSFLLCAAGIAVAPLPAAADRAPSPSPSPSPSIETFEWSMVSEHGRLGAMVIGITPELRKHFGAREDRGVLIARVEPKSAAEAAGLQVGDVLTEVQGRTVDSASDVLSALAPVKQGESASLTVIRDGKSMTLHAKLTTPPASAASAARPRWLDDWFDEMHRRLRGPDHSDWFEDMLRSWPWGPSLDQGKGSSSSDSKRT